MIRYLFVAVILLTPLATQAHEATHDARQNHAGDTAAMGHGSAVPTEPGQGAFAAIQEIVDILVADPHTDWSTVNIDALRQHLVDMSNVTLHAKAHAVPVKNGIRFEATGGGEIRASIRRMVSAHAATMNRLGGSWTYQAAPRPDGAALTVTVSDPADLPKLRGLGFFGVLALGMHHQAHHLMIATGHAPHR